MWRLLSRVRYSVTEESRLQSILAISVVSTKNALLQSQSHFDCDEANNTVASFICSLDQQFEHI